MKIQVSTKKEMTFSSVLYYLIKSHFKRLYISMGIKNDLS